jgi:hypothetical protein
MLWLGVSGGLLFFQTQQLTLRAVWLWIFNMSFGGNTVSAPDRAPFLASFVVPPEFVTHVR